MVGEKSGLSDAWKSGIEVLKRQKPSITYSEIEDTLLEIGNLPLGGSLLLRQFVAMPFENECRVAKYLPTRNTFMQ
jgi:hypothetical protein